MPDKLPSRRSLLSLGKEAKRWFLALGRNDSEARERFERVYPGLSRKPTLRDVQHAIALEHGFVGWTELKQKLEAAADEPARTPRQFEDRAEALLAAYRTGSPEAMERHWALTWHRRNHQAMRTYVQIDLGRQAGAANQNDDITLDDARFLISREHGFENWAALVGFYASLPGEASLLTSKPVRVLGAGNEIDSDQAPRWQSRDWRAVLAYLKESDAPGIDACGQMTDAMLDHVSRLDHITALSLGGSKELTDAGIKHLSRLPRLRYLDLRGTGITDAGLVVLQALPALETVSFAWTRVTDLGASQLSGCERLHSVNLQGTTSGDGALRALAGKSHLCQLKTGNGVTDAGLAFLHEMPVFKSWHGGEPTMGLLSYDAGPNYLLLRGPFTDRGMTQLAGLDGLFALNLDASELGITAAGLAPLVGLPNLGWLATIADDRSMPLIARMPRLRFLGCQDTIAGDDGFAALSQSQSIEYIWGRRCHNLRTRGFTAAARMPALARRAFGGAENVEDAGIAELPSFRSLRELMPMDVPDEGYRHIARCEGLESLVLMYCRETSDAATEHIVNLPRLKSYFASYTRITDRTPELLARMASLERITFSGCAGVTNTGLAHLARLPRLRELRVSGPGITEDVVSVFPRGVRVHYSV